MPDRFGMPRRTAAVAAIGLIVLSACGLGAGPNSLLVLEWAGYDARDFWTDFAEANPETEVTFEFGDTDATILGLMEGGSDADVFHFYTGWQQFYVDAGLVSEIDTSKLTNWDKVPEEYKVLGQIDGKQYFVPWDWGFTSILYNTEQVPEVTSWDVLFDEEYAGHVSMWNDGPGAVTVSSYIHGYDETAITEEQLAAIEAGVDRPEAPQRLLLVERDRALPGDLRRHRLGRVRVAGLLRPRAHRRRAGRVRQPRGGAQLVGRPVRHQRRYGQLRPRARVPGHEARRDRRCGNAVTLFYYGCANADVMAAVDDPFLIDVFSLDDPTILETTNFTPTRDRGAARRVDGNVGASPGGVAARPA